MQKGSNSITPPPPLTQQRTVRGGGCAVCFIIHSLFHHSYLTLKATANNMLRTSALLLLYRTVPIDHALDSRNKVTRNREELRTQLRIFLPGLPRSDWSQHNSHNWLPPPLSLLAGSADILFVSACPYPPTPPPAPLLRSQYAQLRSRGNFIITVAPNLKNRKNQRWKL